MAEHTTEELIARLGAGDPMDRVFAAEELGERGDAPALKELLKRPDFAEHVEHLESAIRELTAH